jgi:hypothetical protein
MIAARFAVGDCPQGAFRMMICGMSLRAFYFWETKNESFYNA